MKKSFEYKYISVCDDLVCTYCHKTIPAASVMQGNLNVKKVTVNNVSKYDSTILVCASHSVKSLQRWIEIMFDNKLIKEEV
jgi:hypothetical protein